MENFQIYRDIQARTGGDIYIGVVGPVRTGKSTFIRRFMELMALPAMEPDKQAEVRDQLPLSGSGKLITTVEPKFIPKEAVPVTLGEDQKVRIKLIDCVGFLVKDASGHIEEGRERMVRTPWFEKSIPFHEAAQVGTRKVIEEHATIGLVVTTDGSFGEIPRQNFAEAEALTVNELKKQGKPFLILVNSQTPYKEETQKLCRRLWDNFGVTTIAANCEQLRKEDVTRILENILYEFPVSEIQFYIPKWVEMLSPEHELKAQILIQIREHMQKLAHIRDITKDSIQLDGPLCPGNPSRSDRPLQRHYPHPGSGSGRILLQNLKRTERHHHGKRIRPDPYHEGTDQYERTVCQGQGCTRSRPFHRLRSSCARTFRDPDRNSDGYPSGK